jgi:manganese/iron transport system permease protein
VFELFQEDFMRRALLGIVLASCNCALLGAYIVTRRMAFMGTALTHTILPGVVFALMHGFSLYWGALGAALLTALGVGGIAGKRELREDAAVGVMLSFMFALGVLMMGVHGTFRDFNALLFGSVLGVDAGDLWMCGAAALATAAALALFHKGLALSSYDEEYAGQCGFAPGAMRLLLLVLTALATVSCVRIVGVLLTTALLVTPAAAAVLLARTLRGVMALSVLFGVAGGAGGLCVSAAFERVPPGAAIVMVCSAIFFAALAGTRFAEFLRRRRARHGQPS